jgi:hypothetical protein
MNSRIVSLKTLKPCLECGTLVQSKAMSTHRLVSCQPKSSQSMALAQLKAQQEAKP